MSLISPKNFAAPFASTVNLVTIVVIALLFGIYRLSGGGVYLAERGQAHAPQRSIQQNQGNEQNQIRQPVQRQQDPFADLLRPSQSKKDAAPENDTDLSDIERQLGLRK